MHRKIFIIILRPAAKWHKHREENYQSQFHPTSGGGAGMLSKLPASRLFSQRTMRQSRIFVFYGLKFHFLSWALPFPSGNFRGHGRKACGSPGGTRFGRIHTVQDSSMTYWPDRLTIRQPRTIQRDPVKRADWYQSRIGEVVSVLDLRGRKSLSRFES